MGFPAVLTYHFEARFGGRELTGFDRVPAYQIWCWLNAGFATMFAAFETRRGEVMAKEG